MTLLARCLAGLAILAVSLTVAWMATGFLVEAFPGLTLALFTKGLAFTGTFALGLIVGLICWPFMHVAPRLTYRTLTSTRCSPNAALAMGPRASSDPH
jgi:hypothetical protein